jgi:hypothetical protein
MTTVGVSSIVFDEENRSVAALQASKNIKLNRINTKGFLTADHPFPEG